MRPEQRVKDLALELPPPPSSAGNYVPGARAAVGMAALTGRMAVEIEMIVEVAS